MTGSSLSCLSLLVSEWLELEWMLCMMGIMDLSQSDNGSIKSWVEAFTSSPEMYSIGKSNTTFYTIPTPIFTAMMQIWMLGEYCVFQNIQNGCPTTGFSTFIQCFYMVYLQLIGQSLLTFFNWWAIIRENFLISIVKVTKHSGLGWSSQKLYIS